MLYYGYLLLGVFDIGLSLVFFINNGGTVIVRI